MAAISISNVEQELDHIAIVDNVLLALGALQTLGLDGGVIEVVGFQIGAMASIFKLSRLMGWLMILFKRMVSRQPREMMAALIPTISSR